MKKMRNELSWTDRAAEIGRRRGRGNSSGMKVEGQKPN